MDPVDREAQKINRKLRNTRRELVRAVERFAEIDPLPGHIAEARRQAVAVRDAAQDAVVAFHGRQP